MAEGRAHPQFHESDKIQLPLVIPCGLICHLAEEDALCEGNSGYTGSEFRRDQ